MSKTKHHIVECGGLECDRCGHTDHMSPTGLCQACRMEDEYDTACDKCGRPINFDESGQFDGVCLSCAETAMATIGARVAVWYQRHPDLLERGAA